MVRNAFFRNLTIESWQPQGGVFTGTINPGALYGIKTTLFECLINSTLAFQYSDIVPIFFAPRKLNKPVSKYLIVR